MRPSFFINKTRKALKKEKRSRITEGEARGLMDAYRSIYEGYGEKKEKEGKKKVMHNCATHGEHAEWGVGTMIQEMHTLDEEGNITHYDVIFEHGIEKNVPVEDLTILEGKMHEHFVNDEKNAEVLDEDLIGDVLSNRGKIKSAATRAITATNRAASATNKALGSAVSDTAKQAQTGVRQTAKDVAKGFQYGGATGAATALGANIVRGIATSGQPSKPAAAKPTPAKPGTPGAPPKPGTPAAPARPAAPAAPARAAAPAARPASPAPAAAKPAPSGQTGDKAKDMATWAKANPTLANKPKTANPLMQKTFGYQSGNAPDQIAKASAGAPPTPSGSALGAAAKPEVRKALNLPVKPATPTQATAAAPSTSAAASGSVAPATAKLASTPKPTPVAPGYQGAKKPFGEEVDAYDLVLDYLLENGHADTVDEAHYVMLEMDSKMIKSIVEGGINFSVPSRIDDFNNRRDELKNRYKQDVGPRIPGPGGGGQYGEPSAPKATGVRLARGTSSSNRGKESKNQA